MNIEDLKKYQLARMQAALYSQSLSDFIKASWFIIEPGVDYQHNWHIDAISEHLTAVKNGQIKRLNINIPPRHAKSIVCSICFPVWVWTTEPSLKFINASYAQDLSLFLSRKRRMILEDDWFKALWGEVVTLSRDQNAKSLYVNEQGGAMLAASTGGRITGFGADIIIADDLLNFKHANSSTIRDSTNQWFREGLVTRLNPKGRGIINIMQRLHEADVSGILGDEWEKLVLPAEYEGSKYVTSLGWSDPRKTEGEALWPNLIPKEKLDELKSMGSLAYAGQFQQRPAPLEGAYVKKQWIKSCKRFDENGIKGYRLNDGSGKSWFDNQLLYFITVDVAITQKTTSDYTVISTWALSPEHDLILADVLREKLTNPEQVKAIRSAYNAYPVVMISIENVGYQLAIVQQMLQEGIPVKAYQPQGKGDKVARFMPVSVFYDNGKIWHNEDIYCLSDLEHEVLTFPNGLHDDFCDTESMAVHYVPTLTTPGISSFEDKKIYAEGVIERKPEPVYEEEWLDDYEDI